MVMLGLPHGGAQAEALCAKESGARMAQDEYRPLTAREMRVYLCLLRETVDELAAYARAVEIIAGMEATGMPVDKHFTMANPPELPGQHDGL